jgi:CRP/FNR family cyclic AMP-dependent transcriptional regulator
MKLTRLWYLEQFNLMERLNKEEMMRLAESTVMKRYEKDSFIGFSGLEKSHVYFLKQGVIKIGSFAPEGGEDIKYLLKEGSIFGELALVDKENPNDMATALEDCLVCIIDVPTMKDMMEKNQNLNNEIFKIMGLRIKKLERRIESILFRDAKMRIIEFIADFVKDFGELKGDTYVAKNYLTNSDIAKLTATSRQTVNAVLNELRNASLIDYNNKFIRIPEKNYQRIDKLSPQGL